MSLALLAAVAALAADPLPEPVRKLHEERLKVAEEAIQLDAALRKDRMPGVTPIEVARAVRSMADVSRTAFESEVALRPADESKLRKADRLRLIELEEFVRIRVPVVLRDTDLNRVRVFRLTEDAALAATPAERAKALADRRTEAQKAADLLREIHHSGGTGPPDYWEEVVRSWSEASRDVRDAALAVATGSRERLAARADYFVTCRMIQEHVRIRVPAVWPEHRLLWAKSHRLAAELDVADAEGRDAILRDRLAVATEWRKQEDAQVKDGSFKDKWAVSWLLATWGDGHRAARDAELALAAGPKEKKAACLAAVKALTEFEKLVATTVPDKATKRDALAATLARLDAELVYAREAGEAPPR